MALNVKFLKGTAAKYAEYIAQNKIEATTFYYIDEQDLYLGLIKLSNAADLVNAISGIVGPYGEGQEPATIYALEQAMLALGMPEGKSVQDLINDAIADIPRGKYYDVAALSEVTNPVEGDVAIVIETKDGVEYRTAYHYAAVEGGLDWKAMAGNYNAANVYYDKNIQVTKTVGNVTTSDNAPVDLEFKGKNMEQIWQYLYATEDVDLSVSQPDASMSVSGSKTAEVGNTFSDPVITISFSDGSYEYGSKDENGNTYTKANGAGVLWNAATIKDSEGNVLKTKSDSSNTSFTCTFDVADNVIKEGSVTYNFSGTASCPASARKPVTNLGNFVDANGKATSVFADGTKNTAAITDKALSGSATVVGQRYCFYGYKAAGSTLNIANLTSAQIRALGNGASTLKSYSTSAPWSTTNMQQMFFAAPKGKYTSVSVANATNGAPQTVQGPISVDVEGYNGFTAAEYDVFYVSNDNADSGAAKYAITLA